MFRQALEGFGEPVSQQVIVGTIGRPHGLKGEVSVRPRTDRVEERFAIGAQFKVASQSFTVAARNYTQGRLTIRFAEVSDRTGAEGLRGVDLWADASQGELDDGEFHDTELVGLVAVDFDGNRLGEVTGVEHHPSQDLLIIRTTSGDRLVPFVAELVPEVDLVGRRVVIDPIPGLLSEVSDAD